MSGIGTVAAGIEAELARPLPRRRRKQRGKSAPLVATMLSERGANSMDPAALPLRRAGGDLHDQDRLGDVAAAAPGRGIRGRGRRP